MSKAANKAEKSDFGVSVVTGISSGGLPTPTFHVAERKFPKPGDADHKIVYSESNKTRHTSSSLVKLPEGFIWFHAEDKPEIMMADKIKSRMSDFVNGVFFSCSATQKFKNRKKAEIARANNPALLYLVKNILKKGEIFEYPYRQEGDKIDLAPNALCFGILGHNVTVFLDDKTNKLTVVTSSHELNKRIEEIPKVGSPGWVKKSGIWGDNYVMQIAQLCVVSGARVDISKEDKNCAKAIKEFADSKSGKDAVAEFKQDSDKKVDLDDLKLKIIDEPSRPVGSDPAQVVFSPSAGRALPELNSTLQNSQ